MYESTFVDNGDLLFTEPRLLNDEKSRARLDSQTKPETCLKPLGCMDDSPQADAVAEREQMNRGRTTVGRDDSTIPSC